MRILVTGAARYIGTVLVLRLLQEGHEVVALDNFMYRQTTLLDCCADKCFSMVRGDARDPDNRDYIVSNAKIEAAGFKARRGLQEGIAELIKAYQILPAQPFGNT